MIIHATRKLAARLVNVSESALSEDSRLGSWHADRLVIDHRQCVLFCHDETRAVLFKAGLRRQDFDDLGGRCFRPLLVATMAALGCPAGQVAQAEFLLGPIRFDTATDRSVLGSMRVVRQDLDAFLERSSHVLDLDPVTVSLEMTDRPTSIHGKWVWPSQRLRNIVAQIGMWH